MQPWLGVVLLWLGFSISHIVLSSVRLRPRIVAAIGAGPFAGLYSLIAFAFFVPLVWIYFANKHAGPWLWNPIGRGAIGEWGITAGMFVALTFVIGGLTKPSPAAVAPGAATIEGIHRLTRHPLIMGLALFGLLHLLPNGSATDVAFFAGFAAFGLVGAWHQDQRKLAEANPAFAAFHAGTPFLPFTGGHVIPGLREIPWWTWLLGVLATAIVRTFHEAWFGGSFSQ